MNFSAILYTPREMTLSLLRRGGDFPKIILTSHGTENWARKKHCAKIEVKKRNGRKLLSKFFFIQRLESRIYTFFDKSNFVGRLGSIHEKRIFFKKNL